MVTKAKNRISLFMIVIIIKELEQNLQSTGN